MAGSSVVVTAATSALGRRVCALTAADPSVDRVIAVDRPDRSAGLREVAGSGFGVAAAGVIEARPMTLADPELKQLCEAASAIVYLGDTALDDGAESSLDGTGSTVADMEGARHLMAAAAGAGVTTLVVLSSAMVYGAWPNNPIPLTEDAPLRPAPELPFAIGKAEIERLAGEWRDDQVTGPTVALLRPVVSVGPHSGDWLGRSPWSTAGVQVGDTEPPSQFVHLDDVASAVDHARRARLDGPFNVAPDGWIPAEGLRALAAPAPRVRLRSSLAERVAALRWQLGLTGTPPSVMPYRMYSWVVANDRLEATGWQPTYTNEMAYVEADRGGPLANLNPKRRQLLSLGIAGAAVVGVLTAVGLLIRRSVTRSRAE